MKKVLCLSVFVVLVLTGCESIADIFSGSGNASVSIQLDNGSSAQTMAVIDIQSSAITQASVTLVNLETASQLEFLWRPSLVTSHEFPGLNQGNYCVIVNEWDDRAYQSCSSNSFYLNRGQNYYLNIALGQNVIVNSTNKTIPPLHNTNYYTNTPPPLFSFPYTNNNYLNTVQYRTYSGGDTYMVENWTSRGQRALLIQNPDFIPLYLSNSILIVSGTAIFTSQWSGDILIKSFTISTN